MSFASDASRIAKDMSDSVENVAAATFIQLFSDVIKNTPVDEGPLQGNWQTTKNSPARGTLEREGESGPINDAFFTINKPGLYYLTNNLPYAETAEFGGWSQGASSTGKTTGDGFSIQAPVGMVRINVKRLDQILRKKARGLN